MKRTAIKLIVFLLLGAATTVGVAWVCAANASPLTRGSHTYIKTSTPIPESVANWWYVWGESSGEVLVNQPFRSLEQQLWWGRLSHGGVSSHALYSLKDESKWNFETLRVRESGWPLRAMRDVVWLGTTAGDFAISTDKAVFHHSLVLGGSSELATTARVLPLQVIGLGFLGNMIFYAAAWWVPIGSLLGLRLMSRIHRGRCPRCGYERHGDYRRPCSECGWKRRGAEA